MHMDTYKNMISTPFNLCFVSHTNVKLLSILLVTFNTKFVGMDLKFDYYETQSRQYALLAITEFKLSTVKKALTIFIAYNDVKWINVNWKMTWTFIDVLTILWRYAKFIEILPGTDE